MPPVSQTGIDRLCPSLGGRHISAEDKNALDTWYVRNASLWLDVSIMLQDAVWSLFEVSESINMALRAVRDGLECHQNGYRRSELARIEEKLCR